jgi:hypothetical protein
MIYPLSCCVSLIDTKYFTTYIHMDWYIFHLNINFLASPIG